MLVPGSSGEFRRPKLRKPQRPAEVSWINTYLRFCRFLGGAATSTLFDEYSGTTVKHHVPVPKPKTATAIKLSDQQHAHELLLFVGVVLPGGATFPPVA
jgi:hypothetical protein